MKLTVRVIIFILCSLQLWSTCCAKLRLTIVHNNDVHVRFAPITEQSSLCRPEQLDTCIAGAARTAQMVSWMQQLLNVIYMLLILDELHPVQPKKPSCLPGRR